MTAWLTCKINTRNAVVARQAYLTRRKICMCEKDGTDICGVWHKNDRRKGVTDEREYIAKDVWGEVRDGAKRKAGDRGADGRVGSRDTEYLEEARGGYIVCTIAISGLISPTPYHHKHAVHAHTDTHIRTDKYTEPLLSRARLGQSIAAHSAWGMELHLIQL